MRTRIKHTSYIIDFLDVDFSSDKISEILQEEVNIILKKKLQKPELSGWEIAFKALYSNVDKILLFRKSASYKNDKYKEIVIHIPIPQKSKVSWGVDEKQLIKTGLNERVLKYADEILINPTDFNNRTDFILACMRKAIRESFKLGFTVNKQKIKL